MDSNSSDQAGTLDIPTGGSSSEDRVFMLSVPFASLGPRLPVQQSDTDSNGASTLALTDGPIAGRDLSLATFPSIPDREERYDASKYDWQCMDDASDVNAQETNPALDADNPGRLRLRLKYRFGSTPSSPALSSEGAVPEGIVLQPLAHSSIAFERGHPFISIEYNVRKRPMGVEGSQGNEWGESALLMRSIYSAQSLTQNDAPNIKKLIAEDFATFYDFLFETFENHSSPASKISVQSHHLEVPSRRKMHEFQRWMGGLGSSIVDMVSTALIEGASSAADFRGMHQ